MGIDMEYGISMWDMVYRYGHPPYRYGHPGYRCGIWAYVMGDDRIDTVILNIDMGYLVTLVPSLTTGFECACSKQEMAIHSGRGRGSVVSGKGRGSVDSGMGRGSVDSGRGRGSVYSGRGRGSGDSGRGKGNSAGRCCSGIRGAVGYTVELPGLGFRVLTLNPKP